MPNWAMGSLANFDREDPTLSPWPDPPPAPPTPYQKRLQTLDEVAQPVPQGAWATNAMSDAERQLGVGYGVRHEVENLPSTPLEFGLYATGLRGLSKYAKAAAAGLGTLFDSSEAQAKWLKPWGGNTFNPKVADELSRLQVLRKPVADMNPRFTPEQLPQIYSEPGDLQIGGQILTLAADRMGLGKLRGVGGQQVPIVDVPGGVPFMTKWSPKGAVWGSEPSIATTLQNRTRNAMGGAAEGAPVYGMTATQGHRSVDFQQPVQQTMLKLIEDSKIKASAMNAFDRKMKRVLGVTENNPKGEWGAVPGWPGLRDPRAASKFLEGQSGAVRNKFGFLMDKAEMMDAGAPNIAEVRHAVTMPELLHVPNMSYGRGIAELSGERLPKSVSKHPAFSVDLGGRNVGGFRHSVPRDVGMLDVTKAYADAGKPPSQFDLYLRTNPPKGLPYIQPVTKEWQAANSAFLNSADKLGEIAAFEKFYREGLKY